MPLDTMGSLGITLNGQPFDHLFYHFVLPYSNWETGTICVSESFEALIAGFQAAVWELGRVPAVHRTDNLSAATHDLREGGRTFNERYRRVLDHYGVRPDANTPGRGHENGDVEQAHHRFKRAIEQALLLRGSRDFESQAHFREGIGLYIIVLFKTGGRRPSCRNRSRSIRAPANGYCRCSSSIRRISTSTGSDTGVG